MSQPGLDPVRSALIRLSSALAGGDPGVVREALGSCVPVVETVQVEETILQSYLFLGYPAALNAFGMWRELGVEARDDGVPDDWGRWSQRGEYVCRIVYGGQYEGLRQNVRELHPDMERWMVVEGYGKVLGRPGLDLITRELCIAALLAVLGAPRQLYSHLRGALNAGARPSEVMAALDLASEYMGGERSREAGSVWERVRARSETTKARKV